MLIIGLTGGLASGKSSVAAMFKAKGASVISADEITRTLLVKNAKCIKKVAKLFPDAILSPVKLNRSKLASIVFSNPRELKKLTDILYPEALKEIKKQIVLHKGRRFIVLDVPLLFEAGWDKITDVTVVVKATKALQFARAKKGLGLSQKEAKARMRHQLSSTKRAALADIIIDNNHSLSKTRFQVEAIINRLSKMTRRVIPERFSRGSS